MENILEPLQTIAAKNIGMLLSESAKKSNPCMNVSAYFFLFEYSGKRNSRRNFSATSAKFFCTSGSPLGLENLPGCRFFSTPAA